MAAADLGAGQQRLILLGQRRIDPRGKRAARGIESEPGEQFAQRHPVVERGDLDRQHIRLRQRGLEHRGAPFDPVGKGVDGAEQPPLDLAFGIGELPQDRRTLPVRGRVRWLVGATRQKQRPEQRPEE